MSKYYKDLSCSGFGLEESYEPKGYGRPHWMSENDGDPTLKATGQAQGMHGGSIYCTGKGSGYCERDGCGDLQYCGSGQGLTINKDTDTFKYIGR